MTFDAAMRHKRVVMEVVVTGVAEGRRPLLGVLYDEVARHRFFCLHTRRACSFEHHVQERVGHAVGETRSLLCS